jgi:sortase A
MDAMKNGVAYFGIPGANSKPGQIGNTVIAGHSSNDVTDPGDYKFIFARLDALTPGDTIYINYLGKRYVYSVTKKEVVKPTDIQALIYTTNKPVITLLTCTPIGTALNRLLVTAEQISPSPSQAAAAPSTSNTGTQPASIPGNSPTFMERIFGGSGN